MILYHANKTHFHKKGSALGLVLRVRVFGSRKWLIKIEPALRFLSNSTYWLFILLELKF